MKPSPQPLSPAALAALQRGNKIEAIRLHREQTGLGLKAAKDAVDAHEAGSAAPPRRSAPGEVPRAGGRRTLWLIAAVVLGFIAYRLLFAADV
jgi:hypothetical protein